MGRLFLLFTLLPMIELWLLIRIGSHIGLLPTLAGVVATGVIGARLAEREGLRAFQSFNRALAEGGLPAQPLMDAACIFVGGALLVTPGVITDAVGLAMLLPATRRGIQKWLAHWLRGRIARGQVRVVSFDAMGRPGTSPDPGRGSPKANAVIDAEFEVEPGPTPSPKPPDRCR